MQQRDACTAHWSSEPSVHSIAWICAIGGSRFQASLGVRGMQDNNGTDTSSVMALNRKLRYLRRSRLFCLSGPLGKALNVGSRFIIVG